MTQTILNVKIDQAWINMPCDIFQALNGTSLMDYIFDLFGLDKCEFF
ncbi:MAG: hypothetical protein WBF77_09935 [Sulfurimonadaceae bacterium]